MNKLPVIAELYNDDSLSQRKDENDLNVLLNQVPKQEWLKDHPTARKEILVKGVKTKVPCQYIPIERIEWLLTRVFINWRVELRFPPQLIGNSVVVSVRLHYQNVVSAEWTWQDGLGACPLQTNKDAGAIEFDKLKSAAVMIAAPAAESYAVKDAAEKIGKLFGKDLNRADQIMYDSLLSTFADEVTPTLVDAKKLIDALDKYTGADKEALRKECAAKLKAGTLTHDFASEVAKKIGASF